MTVRLEWDGKPTEVERLNLPFQTVETINQSRATRDRDSGSLLASQGGDTEHPPNQLIWGDNKLVMSSLLKEYAGKIDLIYIDPPFATGDDFSIELQIGDESPQGAIHTRGARLPRHLGQRSGFVSHNDV
jgi:16S rRNA G966 N2-methylase RsmD